MYVFCHAFHAIHVLIHAHTRTERSLFQLSFFPVMTGKMWQETRRRGWNARLRLRTITAACYSAWRTKIKPESMSAWIFCINIWLWGQADLGPGSKSRGGFPELDFFCTEAENVLFSFLNHISVVSCKIESSGCTTYVNTSLTITIRGPAISNCFIRLVVKQTWPAGWINRFSSHMLLHERGPVTSSYKVFGGTSLITEQLSDHHPSFLV